MDIQKIELLQKDIPTKWYNIQADLPKPLEPPLDPEGNPVTPDQLGVIFPMSLILQEVSQERWIHIPEPVLDSYYRWRTTPVFRAILLEKVLNTPAKIYNKYEGVSPPGSHKPNWQCYKEYSREG